MNKLYTHKELFPVVLISLLLIRILIMGATIGDAIALLALSAYTMFSLYNQTKYDKETLKSIEDLKELISKSQEEINKIKLINEVLERHRSELMDVRQQLAYAKINKSIVNENPIIKPQGNNTNETTKRRLF